MDHLQDSHSEKQNQSNKNFLIAHPFLLSYGGAEYMLSVIANEILPTAKIFTIAYDKKVLQQVGISEDRIISPLKDGFLSKFRKELSIFYPSLIDTYNFSQFDAVISLSYAYVHGLIPGLDQNHYSFILTPMRALWLDTGRYWASKIPILSTFYNYLLTSQRLWDKTASFRPTKLFAISDEVKSRVKAFWGQESEVIYPPVDIDFYKPISKIQKQDYYITHARLVPHKRVDILIDACKKVNKKLVILGDGPELQKLKRLAADSSYIEFKGFVTDEQKREILQNAKAYLFAAYEDFGISMVESLAAGTPVIAYKRGGAAEIVQHKKNGIIFENQSSESLIAAIQQFETMQFDEQIIIESATKFSKQKFIHNFEEAINQR